MSPTIDVELSAQRNNKTSLNFQELLDNIRSAFNRPDGLVNVDELWKVLESYQSDPRDWSKFAYYDMDKYKRNLVDQDVGYDIMLMSWGPGTRSCIHDHSGSHCFMKILDGELIESRFAWPEDNHIKDGNPTIGREMSLISESRLGLNEVLYINDKVGLHRVMNANPGRTSASLHVYSPPIRKCRAFDETTGKACDCKLTFFSKKGKIVEEEQEEMNQGRYMPEC